MPAGIRHLADVLPLSRLTEGPRKAWLDDQAPWTELGWLLGWWAAALVLVVIATRLRRAAP